MNIDKMFRYLIKKLHFVMEEHSVLYEVQG